MKNFMSPTCTNSHYDNHATFVPSINHNKDVALLSYVELYNYVPRYYFICKNGPFLFVYLSSTGHYDDFKVYGKKIYIKRSCSLVFCHHFLYYKLPEIVLPKHGILRFKLTKILWHLLWRVFWWSGAVRRIKTNNF